MIYGPGCFPPIDILNWADVNKMVGDVNEFDLIILIER
jgi:hypothetical protein